MRKALAVIGIILVSLLLLMGGCTLSLRFSYVQTFIVRMITERMSEALNADVSIQRIHYRPLNHLSIDSLYISDQQQDTLLFIEQANLAVNLLNILDNRLDMMHVEMKNPYLNLQSINDTTLNCQFLLDKIQRRDSFYMPLRVSVDLLRLTDLRFRYNEILVDQLQLDLQLPVWSHDSLDIAINEFSLRAQIDQIDAAFNATMHGNLDSLYADQMVLVYRNKCLFDGDIAAYHLTQLDSLYIQANCNDLYCNHALLQDFLSQLLSRTIRLPQPIAQLGHVHYRGTIDGRLEHLNLHGSFKSALGSLSVNGYAESDRQMQHIKLFGHVSTKHFQLGKILNNSDLGKIAFHAHLDANIDSLQLTQCVAEANIQQIDYRGYTYQDIHFDGMMGKEEVSGNLQINDENITLEINGLADWSKEDTRLDMTAQIANLRPNAIHLAEDYSGLCINAATSISMSTSGAPKQMLDNLTGYVIIDSLHMVNSGKQATMNQLKLNIESEWQNGRPIRKISLQSDYLTANLSGQFQYTTLPNTCKRLLHKYAPSLLDAPKRRNKIPNKLEFYAYFHHLDQISQVLDLPISFPSYPTIKGFLNEEIEQMGLQAHIPHIYTSGAQIDNLTISMENSQDSLDVAVYMYNRLPKNNPTAAKIGDVKAHANITALNDKMNVSIQLDNTDSIRNEGTIQITSHLLQYANKPLLNVHLHPTNIILNDSAWTIDGANIIYNAHEKKLAITDFALKTDYQSIAAHGTASPNVEDSITVELRNIDLQYLLGYTGVGDAITVQGPLTGWATLYGLFTNPMVEAQAVIPKAGLNGTYLGDLSAQAYLNREDKTVIIEGQVIDSTNHNVIQVHGKVIPATKWWGLDIHCDSVDINLIDYWTHPFFSNPQGRAHGNMQVSGIEQKVWVTAAMLGKDIQLTIPQLGSTFYLNDSIFLDSTAIRLPHIDVWDAEGHHGTFDGTIHHTYFQNFTFDLNVDVNNMLAMNLPYNAQSLFYGKVYGTGKVNIKGNDTECRINVDARTEPNSKFYLSVNTASVASNSSFVHFVQPDTAHTLLRLLNYEQNNSTPTNTQPRSRFILSLQLEVTPTTDINIRLGGDDGIRGRGEGNIKITYDDSTEDVQMLGTYTLQSGVFSYALGNIVRRNFDIAEGSRVIWSGNYLSPTVDITGRYHTTASLRDLFGSEFSQAATNRSSVPVNCVLYMTDQLFNPTLRFAVELPQSDESVQSQVNSIINTEEMLMRQVIYLLVFNRFYTADYLQNTQTVGLNETYSFLSSTITGQINSWLSKLTDIFTMGFNFRTDGEGETASQEYEANFQLQPIRQLVINGNFGYRYNDLSNRPFFGDLDIEYLLTANGKLRAKAYTHTVDKYSLRQANTVQGVGLVFKHDFNWKRLNKKVRQRRVETAEDATTIPIQDASSTP